MKLLVKDPGGDQGVIPFSEIEMQDGVQVLKVPTRIIRDDVTHTKKPIVVTLAPTTYAAGVRLLSTATADGHDVLLGYVT